MSLRVEWIPLKVSSDVKLAFGKVWIPFTYGEDGTAELAITFNIYKAKSTGELFVSWEKKLKKDGTYEEIHMFGPSKETRSELSAYIVGIWQASNVSINRTTTAERPPVPSDPHVEEEASTPSGEPLGDAPKTRSAAWKASGPKKIG